MEALVRFGLANAGAAAVLAIFVALVTRIWRNPYFAHALCLLVLLRLVAPSFVQIPVHTPDWLARWPASIHSPILPEVTTADPPAVSGGEESPLALAPAAGPTDASARPVARPEQVARMPATSPSSASEPSIAKPIRATAVLGALWIAGTVLYVATTAIRVRRFARGVRRSRSPAPSWLQDEISDLAGSLELRRPPRVAIVEGALPPMVWSTLRPTLLVPQRIVDTINPSQRRLLLLHELLHVRRGDHLIRWFAVAVLALYWWNPIAWWIVRRLQNAEEECCDAAVLFYYPQQSESYGEALLAVSEFVSCGSLPASALSIGVERKNHLKRRMTMILNGPCWPKLSNSQFAAVIGCGAFILGVSLTAASAQVESPGAKAASRSPAHSRTPSDTAGPEPLKTSASPIGEHRREGLALYDTEPLTIAPGDDEHHQQLEERYNSALHTMEVYLLLQKAGQDPATLANLLAGAERVRDAEVALHDKPTTNDLEPYKRYLEFTKYLEKQAEARQAAGSTAGEIPVYDVIQMRQARRDAERLLNERRHKFWWGNASSPKSSAKDAELSTAKNDRAGGPSATRPTNESAGKPVPLVDDAPLKPAPGDDVLEKLLKERYNAALEYVRRSYRRFEANEATPTNAYDAARRLVDAELALHPDPASEIRVRERYLKFAELVEARAKSLAAAGQMQQEEADAARETRLDAEIKLLQTKRQWQAERERRRAKVQSLEADVRIAQAEVAAAQATVEQTRADLSRDEANLKFRTIQFDRIQKLFQHKAINEQPLDEARNERDAAAASVEGARAAIRAAEAQVAIMKARLDKALSELAEAKSIAEN
jgi:beta-lactamase regulating signal transducer with metallopeptidase domain/multidrug resistance efflux pump